VSAAGTTFHPTQKKIFDTIRPRTAPWIFTLLHPRRAMNLQCPEVRSLEVHPAWIIHRHTRHASSPLKERKDLGLSLLPEAIRDAARLGYNWLALTVVKGFDIPRVTHLCREAHVNGMLTMVNAAAALSGRQMEPLKSLVDVLTLEVELPKRQGKRNRIRLAEDLTARLASVRAAGIPFGIRLRSPETVVQHLDWVVELTGELGGSLVQLVSDGNHPVSNRSKLFEKLAELSDTYRGRITIHLDGVSPFDVPPGERELARWETSVREAEGRLAEVIPALAIGPDGVVAPFRPAFPRHFALGNLHCGCLIDLNRRWLATEPGRLCCLYAAMLREERTGGRTGRGVLGELVRSAHAGYSAAG
jgi:hypothetical protein